MLTKQNGLHYVSLNISIDRLELLVTLRWCVDLLPAGLAVMNWGMGFSVTGFLI